MPSPDPSDRPLAHAWRRLAAAVIDAFVLLVPCAALVFLHPAAAVAAAIAYGTFLELRPRHDTLGKRACGVEVEPAQGGELAPRAAFVRNLIKYGGLAFAGSTWGFIVPLAVFAPAFAPARQGLHDLAARTVVRREEKMGLSDVAIGVIGFFGPILLVVGLLPVVLIPVANARARESVQAAIRGAADRRARVEADAAQNGQLPPNAPIVLSPDGVKGSITLTPRMKGRAVEWQCSANGVARGQLPKECRQGD